MIKPIIKAIPKFLFENIFAILLFLLVKIYKYYLFSYNMDYDEIRETYKEFYQSNDYEDLLNEVDAFDEYKHLKRLQIDLEGIIRNQSGDKINATPIGSPEVILDFEDEKYFKEYINFTSPENADGYVINKEILNYPSFDFKTFHEISVIGIQYYRFK